MARIKLGFSELIFKVGTKHTTIGREFVWPQELMMMTSQHQHWLLAKASQTRCLVVLA